MKSGLALMLLAVALGCAAEAAAADCKAFTACTTTFADCTRAKCRMVTPGGGVAECDCKIHDAGLSVGATSACGPLPPDPPTMASRYHPVNAYQICTSSTTWAQCLDVNCRRSSTDPTRASCACDIIKTQTSGAQWIIVRDTYDAAACTDPTIISSATPTQVTQATEFLQQCADARIKTPFVLNPVRP